MTDILGFPPHMAAMIVAVGLTYFLMSWAPVWWPAMVAYRGGRLMPRRFLFVVVVACLSYGIFSFLLFALFFLAEMYAMFVAPQLDRLGYPAGRPVLAVIRFLEHYWWLVLPPLLFAATFFITRKLSSRWEKICVALEG